MSELYQSTYQSRPPIIDGLFYSGAYILVGAPKIGKSFLVAQLAYHVSTGDSLWGYEVRQGTVLYLALEDDFQRIQSRMFMMYGVNDTEHLFSLRRRASWAPDWTNSLRTSFRSTRTPSSSSSTPCRRFERSVARPTAMPTTTM